MPKWKVIGRYERYVMFAHKHNWLPSEVDEQDPRIMDEIAVFHAGRNAAEETRHNKPGK